VSFPLDQGSSIDRLTFARSTAHQFGVQVVMAPNPDFNAETYVFFDKKDLW